VLRTQWFESLPVVRRLIGQRVRHPPLILPLLPGARGAKAEPGVRAPRSTPRRDTPDRSASIDVSHAVRDHPAVGDEAIRAALAGIAAELAASELDERKPRWARFALAAGALIAILCVVYAVRRKETDRRDALAAPIVASSATGEVRGPSGIATRTGPVVSAATTTAASRDTARLQASDDDPLGTASLITVSPETVHVRIASTMKLTATITDVDGVPIAGRSVSWTSSKSRVATVSSTGLVRARNVGTTKITATSDGKKATSVVIVTRRPPAKQSKRRR